MTLGVFGRSSEFFMYVGALATAYVGFKVTSAVLNWLITYFLAGMFGLTMNVKNAGAWAIVTGSTDGIGKAYAEQLAKRGLNIVLISRTRSKLEDLAKEIEGRFNVQTKVIAVDFTRSDIYSTVKTELEGLDVGTLVNNVGMGYPHPEYFAQLENADQLVLDMINCNCTSAAMMTSLVLPGMLAKRKGVIINIGSASGLRPTALLSLYTATKAFVDFFSRSLQLEYASQGITIQSVMPYFVATKLSKIRNASLFSPSPTSFVSSALQTVGVQSQALGCWPHAVQDVVLSRVPHAIGMHFLKQVRGRALKKKGGDKRE